MPANYPIANEYVIELPQLIDILPTKQEIINLKEEKCTVGSPDHVSDWDGQVWYSASNNNKVKNAFSLFNKKYLHKELESWICTKIEGKWIRPHIDTDRLAVLIYPIVPESYDMQFTDKWLGDNQLFFDSYDNNVSYDYSVIRSHTYRCPTILNSKIPHCVPSTTSKTTLQISLHFGGDHCSNWHDILNAYRSGDLINFKGELQ